MLVASSIQPAIRLERGEGGAMEGFGTGDVEVEGEGWGTWGVEVSRGVGVGGNWG